MQTQKAFMLVSKDWYEAALPSLYRNVVLHRASQIFALARTFRSNPGKYGPLVKRLSLCGTVPPYLSSFIPKVVPDILSQCSRLEELSLEISFMYSTGLQDLWTQDGVNNSLKAVQANLKAFNLLPRFKSSAFVVREEVPSQPRLIAGFNNLTALTIAADHGNPVDQFALSSPSLETLCLWSEDGPHRLPTTWQIPKLNTLRFRPYFRSPNSPSMLAFFTAYGQGIRQLDFGSFVSGVSTEDIETAVTLCPKLEYLHIPERYALKSVYDSSFARRKLKTVDVATGPSTIANISWNPKIHGEKVPEGRVSWRHVRVIHGDLLEVLPDLPYLFNNPPATNETRSHDLFGVKLVETNHSLYPPGLVAIWDSDAGADSDSEYSYPSSDDSLTVSTDTSTGESDYILSDGPDEEDYLSEALAAFS